MQSFELTVTGLAAVYDISISNTSDVVRGIGWAHIPIPDYSLRDHQKQRRARIRAKRLDERRKLYDQSCTVPNKDLGAT